MNIGHVAGGITRGRYDNGDMFIRLRGSGTLGSASFTMMHPRYLALRAPKSFITSGNKMEADWDEVRTSPYLTWTL